MIEIFKAQALSPEFELASGITDTDTTISLVDASGVLAGPGILTIGDAEVTRYESVVGNNLTGCTRGYEGAAQSWPAGTKLVRAITAHDIDAVNDNLETHLTSAAHFSVAQPTSFVATPGNEEVVLTWANPTNVVVKDTSNNDVTLAEFDTVELKRDGVVVYNGNLETYTDTGLTNNQEYTYQIRSVTTGGIKSSAVVATATPVATAVNYGPGSTTLVAGDMTAGFFGEVTSEELITGADLCSSIGLTPGTLQHSTAGWLKFAFKEKILFIAKKPIRRGVTWNHIYSAGAVYGTGTPSADTGHNPPNTDVNQSAEITIGDNTYIVRLMRGAADNPTNSFADADLGAKGPDNEWNALMLPIHIQAPDNWEYPAYVDSPTSDWGVDYTDADLLLHHEHGDGSITLCQETQNTDTSRRIGRARYGVSNMLSWSAAGSSSANGYRPVLELKQ